MTKKKAISAKVVEIVQERANGYCETCGGSAQLSMALHHRKLRSRGGGHTVSNLISVHHGCHNLNTDSIHLSPGNAQNKGWIVASWQEPEETPFAKPDGSHVLLHQDGSITIVEAQDEHSSNGKRQSGF